MSNFNLADYIQPPTGSAKPAERKLQMIPTRKIFANDKNFYDTSKVDDLIDSILMQGLLDPLTVRPSGDGDGYIIISGHRRHRALMTILDDQLAEDTKPFETTPCFVREPGDELMEELMLIQANSATRVLTSAETSKQVDRVRDLLYGLKSHGYEFPGRMRDYVASACNISASKIARLDTIKAKLIPEIKQYYDDGRMPESVAYEIAKCSADDQRLIAKVKGNGQNGLGAMRCGEAERILSDRDSLAARKCKYACGVPCGNVVKSLQKTTGNYMRSCENTCCMECYDIATCDKYCKIAKDKHLQMRAEAEAEEQRREERLREERKQRDDKCAAYWARLHDAIDQHGHSAELAAVMHITETALKAGGTYYAPYRQCMPESLDALVAAADILGVSTDYLLGRTDDPHFTTLPQRESKKEDDA